MEQVSILMAWSDQIWNVLWPRFRAIHMQQASRLMHNANMRSKRHGNDSKPSIRRSCVEKLQRPKKVNTIRKTNDTR